MKRALLVSALCCCACHDFSAAIEKCKAEGRCYEAQGGGTAGTGGGTAGGSGGGAVAEPPVLSASVDHLDFMDVAVNSDSAPQTVTITNVDGGVATGLAVVSSAPLVFTVPASCPATLAPGAHCDVSVVFKPKSTVAYDGGLTVTAALAAGLAVALQGTGVVGTLEFMPNDFGDFGGLQLDGGLTRNASVKNTSLLPISQFGLSLGADGGPFSLSYACASSLAAGASCPFSLTAAPHLKGRQNGRLTATADGVDLGLNLTVQTLARLTVTHDGGVPAELRISDGLDGGISCPPSCDVLLPHFSTRTLTATPTRPRTFMKGWAGVSGCLDAGPCDVAVNDPLTVTARVGAYNYFFVTAGQFQGSLGGLAGADAKCQTEGSALGPGTYHAWIADSDGGTAGSGYPLEWRVAGARGWVRPDGRAFIDRLDGAGAEWVIHPPLLDANLARHGVAVVQQSPWVAVPDVWTGASFVLGVGFLGADGSTSSANCFNWVSAAAGPERGYSGGSAHDGTDWAQTLNGTGFCNQSKSLYCAGVDFNEPLQVQVPPGARRAFVSSTPAPGSTSRAAADAICQADAAAAGLSGSSGFLAMRAEIGETPLGRFKLDAGTWYRMDGAQLAATPGDLLSTGGIQAPLSKSADGGKQPLTFATGLGFISYAVWLGAPNLATAGTSTTTCAGWTGAGTGNVAWATAAQDEFWNRGATNCTDTLSLFCFEQ